MKNRLVEQAGRAAVSLPGLVLLGFVVWTNPAAAQDAQLRELLAEAASNNPEIQLARNELEAAGQRASAADALDDPMLELGVVNAPMTSRIFRREDMTMKMLGLSQRLPFPGKRGLRREVADKDAEVAAHALQESLNRVARDVKSAYFELALVIESARLVERNRRVLEQFLGISEARYAVGQGMQADVLKAQTQLTGMEDELLKLGRERRMAESELVRLLGRAPDAPAPVPLPLGLQETPLPLDALFARALETRPQLLGLQSMVDRNAKSIELVRKEYFPDFDLKLSYGQRDAMLDGTPREDMISLMVAVNLPIWRARKLDPMVAEAIAMRNQASDMYQSMRNEVLSELRRQAAVAEQNLKSARLYETRLLPQARLAVESSLAAYRVNRVEFLTLLDDQMAVFNYEIGYAMALSGYNRALADIEFIVGGPPQ